MSAVALLLNLVLAGLLVAGLVVGLRLEKRLRTLREGQAEFLKAVAELDRAAARAQAGLVEIRAASDETVELLADRIQKGRALAAQLDGVLKAAAGGRPAAPAPAPAQAAPAREAEVHVLSESRSRARHLDDDLFEAGPAAFGGAR